MGKSDERSAATTRPRSGIHKRRSITYWKRSPKSARWIQGGERPLLGHRGLVSCDRGRGRDVSAGRGLPSSQCVGLAGPRRVAGINSLPSVVPIVRENCDAFVCGLVKDDRAW